MRRGSLLDAVRRGKDAALARFKLAGPMGADSGVMPRGEEHSHGTDSVQYARREPEAGPADASRANMPDWLWDIFTTHDRGMAPGRADGTFGQEVIG